MGAKFVNAPALQAVSCGSVTRHLQCCARQYFHWELPRLADNLAAWEVARWTAAGCPKGAVSRERDSSINRPSKNLSEGDLWSITTNSHHFITPTPRVPKPKSSRRTVVNRVTNECKSRRDRCCARQYLRRAVFSNNKKLPCAAPSGTRKIANPRRLGRRDTRSVTGVPDHFPSP